MFMDTPFDAELPKFTW